MPEPQPVFSWHNTTPHILEWGLGHDIPGLVNTYARLRPALYFPAMVALRHNLIVRAFGDRLKATGHTGKSMVVAAMRKLLHLIYGVLQSSLPFDPNYSTKSLLFP